MKHSEHYSMPPIAAHAANGSPTKVFEPPKNVLDVKFSPTEENNTLRHWEAEAHALQSAADEGVLGGKPPEPDDMKRTRLSPRRIKELLGRGAEKRSSHPFGGTGVRSFAARYGATPQDVAEALGCGLAGLVGAFVLVTLLVE